MGSSCGSSTECLDDHSFCDDEICRCEDSFFDKDGVCCKLYDALRCVFRPYMSVPEVGMLFSFSVPRGRYGSPCLNGFCVDIITECRQNLCLCARSYFYRDGFCVPKILTGDPCRENDVCNDTNAECRGGSCQCIQGSALINGKCGEYK